MKKYIPDLLALFRIFSAPVILYLLLLDGTDEGFMLVPAIIAFIAAWTDFFDGRLARKWNVSSKTGAFLDSIADKISLIVSNKESDELIYFDWLESIKKSLIPTILTKHIDNIVPINGKTVKQNPIKKETNMNCNIICGYLDTMW